MIYPVVGSTISATASADWTLRDQNGVSIYDVSMDRHPPARNSSTFTRFEGSRKLIETAFISLFLTAAALAQTARIEGEVFDAITHQPLSDTRVSLRAPYRLPQEGSKAATTDSDGRFSFEGISGGGEYELNFKHQGYSNLGTGDVRKIVEVSVGTTMTVKLEMVPAASAAGHILDENGKPLKGCTIKSYPVDVFRSRITMGEGESQADGFYGTPDLYPGRYWITAQCRMPAQHGSSEQLGSPATAYTVEFHPGVTDPKSAGIVNLLPGEHKLGVDIRMVPVYLTSIRGRFPSGNADWRGRHDLGLALVPLDRRAPVPTGYEQRIDVDKGSFELRQVPPGSYRLVMFSQHSVFGRSHPTEGDRIGGEIGIDADGHPLEVSLELHRAIDIQGRVEIQRGKEPYQQIDPHYILVQLVSDYLVSDPPPAARLKEDGTFTIKSVPPGQWRIALSNQPVFVKSVWFGNESVRGGYLDLTAGVVKPLRIIASSNCGAIEGVAPPGSWLLYARLDETYPAPSVGAILVGGNGKFGLAGLAPGKYRLNVGDPHGPLPEEG
jgi:hypothetical protein